MESSVFNHPINFICAVLVALVSLLNGMRIDNVGLLLGLISGCKELKCLKLISMCTSLVARFYIVNDKLIFCFG